MADATLVAQIEESTQEILDTTKLYFDSYSPMAGLSTRKDISKGHDSFEMPFVDSVPNVVHLAEGDDVPITSQFSLSSRTIDPVHRVISFKVSDQAAYLSRDQLITFIAKTMAMEEARDVDRDLLAEISNFTTTAGTTNTDITVATVRTARRKLQSVATASGGPVRGNLALVLPPIPLENLMTDLGLQGVVSNAVPWIPDGYSQDLIKTFHVSDSRINVALMGLSIFTDSNMEGSGGGEAGDYTVPLFPREALYLCVWWDWRMKTYDDSDFVGTKVRADAYYNSGVGPYPAHGCAITVDGA